MRLGARTSLYCHEYLHKKNAPNRFNLMPLAKESEVAKERKRLGDEHEVKVIEFLKSTGLVFVQIDQSKAIEDREVDTAKALLDPTIDLIFGATIGATCEFELQKTIGKACQGDPDRTSRPDLLVKTGEVDGRPLWSPVDIKSHGTIVENKSSKLEIMRISTEGLKLDNEVQGRLKDADLMQLAHYVEHLGLIGVRDTVQKAGIIGREGDFIAWSNLDQTFFGSGKSAISVMTKYHQAFAEAKEVIAEAFIHAKDPNQPGKTIPMLLGDMTYGCTPCEYREICMREMKAFDNTSGHVTLLASVTAPAREKNFPDIHSIKVLRDATGLNDFGETSRIRARVWLSKEPELLDPTTPLNLPEFDVEVDIDLENSMKSFQDSGESDVPGKDRVYL